MINEEYIEKVCEGSKFLSYTLKEDGLYFSMLSSCGEVVNLFFKGIDRSKFKKCYCGCFRLESSHYTVICRVLKQCYIRCEYAERK